jgi:mRNA interferase MazF
MPKIQQGSVVWAEMPMPFGRRPVLVLTRDSAIRSLNGITIAAITRTIRKIPTEVILEPADGVPTICAVTLDNIFTVPRDVLGKSIVALNRELMLKVFAAVRHAFDIP